jgi:hypothetical protein
MRAFFAVLVLFFIAGGAAAQSTSGTLGPSDPQRDNGSYYDATTIDVESPQEIIVRMESTAFDTYLVVKSPSGFEQINDDFEGQSVSQIELLATETGKWTIWATSYESAGTGAYDLRITRSRSLDVSVAQGRLDYTDRVALKGEYVDTQDHDFSGSAPVIVELISFGFDGYLVVTAPDGQVWRNDDYNGSTTVARVGPVSGPAGKWRIDVTSVQPGEQGAYDLRFVRVNE